MTKEGARPLRELLEGKGPRGGLRRLRLVAVSRIELELCDITSEQTDAIVNAANPRLTNGGGVAAAIRRAAGPGFQEECERLVRERGEVETGADAVATGAYSLPCRWVIHVVGPVWREHDPQRAAELLAGAHRSAIALAEEIGAASLSFPAISTGIYGYPVEQAAPVAITAAQEALAQHPGVELVRFCLFSEKDLEAFGAAAAELA